MAERHSFMDGGQQFQVPTSRKTVVLSSLAGLALGGPFLVMMGFSFLTSLTLLLVTSPLLIIFSPLLFGAGCVFAFAMTGFATAAAFSLVGLSSFAWAFRSSFRDGGVLPLLKFDTDVSGKVIESGEAVKEHGKDWAGHLQHKVQNHHDDLVNRGY